MAKAGTYIRYPTVWRVRQWEDREAKIGHILASDGSLWQHSELDDCFTIYWPLYPWTGLQATE